MHFFHVWFQMLLNLGFSSTLPLHVMSKFFLFSLSKFSFFRLHCLLHVFCNLFLFFNIVMNDQNNSTTWQLQQFQVFSHPSLFCFRVSFPCTTQAIFFSSYLCFTICVASHVCSEFPCNDDSFLEVFSLCFH